MKKLSTLMALMALSLASCDTSNKRKENISKDYSMDQSENTLENTDEVTFSNVEHLETKNIYKAIFSVRYDKVARLNKNTDKLFIRSENAILIKDIDFYNKIKDNLETSLSNQGFNLTSNLENNVEVIIENNNSKELYMPHYLNITFKKHFKGDSILVIRATMRVSHEDLKDNPSIFIDKFVKVILQGKTLTNNSIEWIVE